VQNHCDLQTRPGRSSRSDPDAHRRIGRRIAEPAVDWRRHPFNARADANAIAGWRRDASNHAYANDYGDADSNTDRDAGANSHSHAANDSDAQANANADRNAANNTNA
jgi:hypothetical protein